MSGLLCCLLFTVAVWKHLPAGVRRTILVLHLKPETLQRQLCFFVTSVLVTSVPELNAPPVVVNAMFLRLDTCGWKNGCSGE